jgi:uncharacterized protein YceH (UPF0502 family)
MNIELNREEARIIGCLMEKAVTTPDQYPLTLNALTNACNQKSSREPVLNLHQGDVQRTCNQLKEKHFISIETGFKNNAEKYTQRLCNTLLSECQFDEGEYAIVCLLLLRGPQTPGELRSRSGRLHHFEDSHGVVESLKGLMERETGSIVARLPKQAGRQDHEYAHLFQGDVESVPEDLDVAQRVTVPGRDQQISKLESRIDALENALVKLAEQLGEELDLGEVESES